jgi:transcriptional regulator with XRE-family HTH domain
MDLRDKIKSKGLKQKVIADKIGIKESILSRYLSGDRKMPEEIRKKIVKILNSVKFFLE